MNRLLASTAIVAVIQSAATVAFAATIPSITTTATGARALGLAGITAAPVPDAEAAQSNPAALALLPTAAMNLAHHVVGPGIAVESGAFALPWRTHATFGITADIHSVDGRPAGNATSVGSEGTYAARAGLHAAVPLPHDFAVGVGIARYSSTLAGGDDKGICTDAGLMWAGHGFRAGAALRGWSFDAAPEDARAWSAGVARTWRHVELATQVDGDRAMSGVGGGAAVTWRATRTVELRAGTHYEEERGTRFGGGLALAVGAARLEWGCRVADGERTENVVGLAVAFGDAAARGVESKAAAPKPARSSKPKETKPKETKPKETKPTAAKATAPGAAATAVPTPAPVVPPVDVSPMVPDREAEDSAPAAPSCWTVTAGMHPDLETASGVIFKLRAVDLRPTVERRGAEYAVVVQRCVSHQEAEALQARARRGGVRVTLDAE